MLARSLFRDVGGWRRRSRQRAREQMTKDQKADTGGDPWESRRPLVHHWAPGQGHSTCELLWKKLPTWTP